MKENGAIVPQPVRQIVAPQRQRDAIDAVLSTLDPAFLEIPQRILDADSAARVRLRGRQRGAVRASHHAGVRSDQRGHGVADITLAALLDPRRAARLVAVSRRERGESGDSAKLTNRLIDVAMTERRADTRGAITRATRTMLVDAPDGVSPRSDSDDPQVRAEAAHALRKLAARLAGAVRRRGDRARASPRHARRHREVPRPQRPRSTPKPPEVPPGPPIGD